MIKRVIKSLVLGLLLTSVNYLSAETRHDKPYASNPTTYNAYLVRNANSILGRIDPKNPDSLGLALQKHINEYNRNSYYILGDEGLISFILRGTGRGIRDYQGITARCTEDQMVDLVKTALTHPNDEVKHIAYTLGKALNMPVAMPTTKSAPSLTSGSDNDITSSDSETDSPKRNNTTFTYPATHFKSDDAMFDME